MDRRRRRALAEEALAGVVSGPAVTHRAQSAALQRLPDARAVILVEGVSDQIAVETVARRRHRILEKEGIVVLPVGGASAAGGFVSRLGPKGRGLVLAGLCDSGEEGEFRAALMAGGYGRIPDRGAMQRFGFFVCVEDLEDELIRAAGRERIEDLLESQGDMPSFRTLQQQPAWRGRTFSAQMRRYLGAGAGRKLRYARRIVEALDPDRIPSPLDGVLDAVRER